jgi:hypothetical protein
VFKHGFFIGIAYGGQMNDAEPRMEPSDDLPEVIRITLDGPGCDNSYVVMDVHRRGYDIYVDSAAYEADKLALREMPLYIHSALGALLDWVHGSQPCG